MNKKDFLKGVFKKHFKLIFVIAVVSMFGYSVYNISKDTTKYNVNKSVGSIDRFFLNSNYEKDFYNGDNSITVFVNGKQKVLYFGMYNENIKISDPGKNNGNGMIGYINNFYNKLIGERLYYINNKICLDKLSFLSKNNTKDNVFIYIGKILKERYIGNRKINEKEQQILNILDRLSGLINNAYIMNVFMHKQGGDDKLCIKIQGLFGMMKKKEKLYKNKKKTKTYVDYMYFIGIKKKGKGYVMNGKYIKCRNIENKIVTDCKIVFNKKYVGRNAPKKVLVHKVLIY